MYFLLLPTCTKIDARLEHFASEYPFKEDVRLALRIIGSSAYLPSTTVDNRFYEEKFSLTPGWIQQRTGIVSRRIATAHESVSYMATQCAESLLHESGVDFLLCATASPDSLLPSMANRVAQNLGLNNILCLDIMSGCAAYLQGLIMVDSLLRSGNFKRGLLIGAERMGYIIDPNDRKASPVFGDAAAGLLFEHDAESECLALFAGNIANGLNALQIPIDENISTLEHTYDKKVVMEGKAVFKEAITALTYIIRRVLQEAKLGIADIDYIVPHQANARILESVCKELGIPEDKMLQVIPHCGNIVNASIPYTTHYYRDKLKNKTVLFCGFGAGFNYAAYLLRNGL